MCVADTICHSLSASSEFMGKTFQAAQLTHERFLTIDHSYKIFFDICQTELPLTSGTRDSTSKTSSIFLHCEEALFRIQQTLTHHLFFTWKICRFSYLFLQRMKRGLPEEIGFRSFFTQLNSRTFFPLC